MEPKEIIGDSRGHMVGRPVKALEKAGLKAKRKPLVKGPTLIGILFLLPAVGLMTYSSIIPSIWNFILSFQNANLETSKWNGIDNYVQAFQDNIFLASMWRSIFLAVVITFFGVILGVALAIMIYPLGKVEGAIYRLIIFTPTMLPSVIVGLMFTFVFNPETGIINNVLRLVGLGDLAKAWLSNPDFNMWAISVVGIWRIAGLPMIFTYAALQSIPIDLLEASKLDGATYVKQALTILVPLLKPIITISAVFTLILSFKSFDLVYALTKGGPGSSSRVVPISIIDTAFKFDEFGYAAAQGVLMIVVILILVFIVNRVLRSETYEY